MENLTLEEKKALKKQWADEEKAAKAKRRAEVATLKEMIDEIVQQIAPGLAVFGLKQNEIVENTYNAFSAVIALKNELYGVADGQASHTFSSRDGNGSITIGYNEIIGFDGTEGAGVVKIKQVISALSSDDGNREILADLLNTFMKPDKKGNLNPTRIAELVSKKEKVNDPLFSEGVDIIIGAQFKTRTSMYVRGWWRKIEENGKEIKLKFSITAN